jgi:hypothetical protein
MQAIEFKTTIQNGIVTIPPEYSAQWEGKVIRFIALNDSENIAPETTPDSQPLLKAISLQTKEFKFNREDANVR